MAAIIAVISVIVALGCIFYAFTKVRGTAAAIAEARQEAQEQIEEARRGLEAEKREQKVAVKEEETRLRERLEGEIKATRSELDSTKRRLDEREDNLEKRKQGVDQRVTQIEKGEQRLVAQAKEAEELVAQRREEVERVAAMNTEEARKLLLSEVERDTRHEMAQLVRRIEDETRKDSDRRAAGIVGLAIQRCAVDQTTETTVSVVPIPSDEMKGRIIGREGRNIRAFEQLTGIDLIVDDTPEAVVLSGFDPVRREIAKVALEILISDGRIHPGRIEETIERARKLTQDRMDEAAEQATFETGVTGLHPEIIKHLGKLRFRTSHGQNVLKHSIEVSHLAGAMAGELGVRVAIAKRGGLLHDLGKSVDYERDGSHTQIGAEIAKARGESADIIHCIMAHHEDVQIETVEAALVQAADAISASRPGARRETLEIYLKRLEGLEKIASSFEGVDRVFAIQAGREVRVLVKPDRVDDLQAHRMAKGMAERIEGELDYPGQIRVTIIRETRAVEYAK